MKNFIKILGLIAFTAIIIFSLTASSCFGGTANDSENDDFRSFLSGLFGGNRDGRNSGSNRSNRSANESRAIISILSGIIGRDNNKHDIPYRDPRNENERVAMQFVQALWENDYDTVVALTDIDSLYPAAPGAGGNNILTEIILRRCVAYKEYSLHWSDPGEINWIQGMREEFQGEQWRSDVSPDDKLYKVLGIVDYRGIRETVVGHGVWNVENEYGFVMREMDMLRLNIRNGKVTAWALNEDTGRKQIHHTRLFIPANTTVTFRGQKLTPHVTGHDRGIWDVYRLEDMQLNKYEEISVDFGGRLGVIKDWISTSSAFSGPASGPIGGYLVRNNMSSAREGSAGRDFFTNLRGLSITGEVYRPIWKEVQDASEKIISTMYAALKANDYSMVAGLLCDVEQIERQYESYSRRDGYLRSSFDRWIAADRRESWARFNWRSEAYSTRALTKDTLIVWNNVTMTTGSGIEYEGTVELHLRYVDGQWKLAYVSSFPIFSRSTQDWRRVQ